MIFFLLALLVILVLCVLVLLFFNGSRILRRLQKIETAIERVEQAEEAEEGPPPIRPPVPGHFDEPALATVLGIRLVGSPANGAPTHDVAPSKVIWVEHGDEVLVHLDSTRVKMLDGSLLVSVDLETDQTGRQPLVLAFALGGHNDDGGLVATTDELPRGNPALAARWGPALQAAVWSSLLGLASDHADDIRQAPHGITVSAGELRLHRGPPLRPTGVSP